MRVYQECSRFHTAVVSLEAGSTAHFTYVATVMQLI